MDLLSMGRRIICRARSAILPAEIVREEKKSANQGVENGDWHSEKELEAFLERAASTEEGSMRALAVVSGPLIRSSSADFCLIQHGPFWILRAAENGNAKEFEQLYLSDPSRLQTADHRGRTVAHQAAAKDRVTILQLINTYGGDLNVTDSAGNTPLHIAIVNDALKALAFLLQCPTIQTDILNDKKQAPIHLVTELNKVDALKILSQFRAKVNIQQGGEHGRTALHLAAIYDYEECARHLITEFGACPRQPCNNGYYPIHEAAKNASSKTMEVFLQWGEARGCSREEMISFYDSEGNVPLHSAVHGGDYRAVELCLNAGAKISTQQHDKSTPVHLACAQGALDIVRLMFTMQKNLKATCLALCDAQMMTPLHCAAMFDHPNIVEYLVAEGADMNCLDKENRSPLLLAASRAGWKTVLTLIRLGANVLLKDSNQRNVLTLVVMNGGALEEFSEAVIKAKCTDQLNLLLNEKDETGCSPLHYASREGYIKCLESLLRLGACINQKNNKNESALHFAARYGRFNTVRQLLNSEKGSFIINESDGEGLTPLHIASQNGHTRVVQLLLNRGALLHRDHNGRTPLHLAAMSGYTQTMELLHSIHSHLLDQVDKDGNTALHLATMENKPNAITLLMNLGCKLAYNHINMSAVDYAIQYKLPDSALAMVTHSERSTELLALKSDKYPCVTLALIASMPKVFEAVQDSCITRANCKKDSKSFYIKYHFSCLQCPRVYGQVNQKTGEFLTESNPTPLPALNAMVTHGRVDLLAHPLSHKYLQMKWHAYGKYFHLINLLFYVIFLIFVTTYAIEQKRVIESSQLNNETFNNELTASYSGQPTSAMFTLGSLMLTYVLLNTVREGIQMYIQRWVYLLDPTNLVSWLLYIATCWMVLPDFVNSYVADDNAPYAAVTIFLTWFNLLLYLQRFDSVGIYVVMFLEILQTLIRVLLIFSILIVAFGLAFFILLHEKRVELYFNTEGVAMMRTFAMMLEMNFVESFVKGSSKGSTRDESPLPHTEATYAMLVIFMVLMPILLMNLLIGLAVGDIESVRRNAQLKRLAMQVIMHSELERKLPAFFLDRVDKLELIEYPNEKCLKSGLFDIILKKWIFNGFDDNANPEGDFGNNNDIVFMEVMKHKRRLREIAASLETQHQFLRLIAQKMEIKTEADDVDEGISPNQLKAILNKCGGGGGGGGGSTANSPSMPVRRLRSVRSFARSTSSNAFSFST